MLKKLLENDRAIFVLLTLLAMAFRLPTSTSPLMGDEAISFNQYGGLPWREILFNYPDPNQHTLFSLISNVFLSWWGEREWVFRLPSLIVGVLAVPLVYQVGKSLSESRFVALVASLFLASSASHINYSHSGRGYALTVFLCLAVTGLAYAQVQKEFCLRRSITSGVLLVICSVSLVLTLPSNAFFLFAVFVSSFLKIFFSGVREEIPFLKRAAPFLISFFFSFFLVALYLLSIREGLNAGIANYSQPTLNLMGLLEIGKFLFAPWGLWFFLLFILGLFSFKGNKNFLFIAALLGVPVVLTVVSGVVGFPRVYIYFLPFLLMVAGVGIESQFRRLWIYNSVLGKSLALALVLVVAGQFYSWAILHYPKRINVSNGTMAEARLVKNYIDNEVSFDHFLIFAVHDPVANILNHYLSDQLRNRMELFLAGKEVKKILFVSHVGAPPDKFPWVHVFKEKPLKIPASYLLKIKEFGKLHIYEFDVFLTRWDSGKEKRDTETVFAGVSDSTFESYKVQAPKLFGNYSLRVENKTGMPALLKSPISKQMKAISNTAFVLNYFVRTAGKTLMGYSGGLGNFVLQV